jgi:hypothetical protein
VDGHAYGFLARGCWIRFIRFAANIIQAMEPLLKTVEKLNKYGVKNYRIFVYVLVKDVDDANKRCKTLKRLGVNPFVQVYRNFDGNIPSTNEQKRLNQTGGGRFFLICPFFNNF